MRTSSARNLRSSSSTSSRRRMWNIDLEGGIPDTSIPQLPSQRHFAMDSSDSSDENENNASAAAAAARTERSVRKIHDIPLKTVPKLSSSSASLQHQQYHHQQQQQQQRQRQQGLSPERRFSLENIDYDMEDISDYADIPDTSIPELGGVSASECKQFVVVDHDDDDDTSVSHNNHHHHDLPSVEEYKCDSNNQAYLEEEAVRLKLKKALFFKRAVGVAALLLLTCIGVTTGILVARREEDGTTTPTATSRTTVIPGSTTLERAQHLIVSQKWSDLESLQDVKSAQYQAWQWIAQDGTTVPTHTTGPNSLVHVKERYALAVFYFSTSQSENGWKYTMNFLSDKPVCEWTETLGNPATNYEMQVGVTCNDELEVTELYFPSNTMVGTLPDELSLLSQLQSLNIYKNQISGKLPESLQYNVELKHVILHDNAFVGTIPRWISAWTNLQTLNLANNKFTGYLPSYATFSALKASLQTLNLNSNMMIGELTPLEGLKSEDSPLQSLLLEDNDFHGKLNSNMLESWKSLQVLDLSKNRMIGSLPSNLFSHSTLQVVDLHGNSFNGHLPTVVHSTAGSIPLKFVALQSNNLNGPITPTISGLSQLEHFDVSRNGFTGVVPTQLGSLSNLKYLYMAFNYKLRPGPIPAEIGQLPKLQDVSFQATNRNGPIPFDLNHCSDLQLLDLQDNDLTGTIPEELGAPGVGISSQLRFVLLAKNPKLSGSIPASFSSLHHLDTLILKGTNITSGTDHVCIPQLSELTDFVMECDNLVDGEICTCCKSCCSSSSGDNAASRVGLTKTATTTETTKDGCDDSLIWFSQMNPISDYQYTRNDYKFHKEDDTYRDPQLDQHDVDYFDQFGTMPSNNSN